MATLPPSAPSDEPWDEIRIEAELRSLRDHAETVKRRLGGALPDAPPVPARRTWTETFAPWVVPALVSLMLGAAGWAIHQHDLAANSARQYAEQQQAQDLKLTGMEVRLLAMEQTIQSQRAEQEKLATLSATVNILIAESSRARDRLERLEQRR